MILTKLLLNPENRLVRQDVTDCQRLHARVLSMFPQIEPAHEEGVKPRTAFEILYRLENDLIAGANILLVQSNTKPNWRNLPQGYISPGQIGVLWTPMDRAIDSIIVGMRLRFKLRANPTKKLSKIKKDDRLAGKRVAILDDSAKLAWLDRKSGDCGFRIVSVSAKPDVIDGPPVPDAMQRRVGTVHGRKDDKTLTYGAVLFEGRLEVINRDAFINSIQNGIGSGKAYGFGLLSFVPES